MNSRSARKPASHRCTRAPSRDLPDSRRAGLKAVSRKSEDRSKALAPKENSKGSLIRRAGHREKTEVFNPHRKSPRPRPRKNQRKSPRPYENPHKSQRPRRLPNLLPIL